MLHEVEVQAHDPRRLEELIGPERADQFESTAAAARSILEGRRIVNVNSTATRRRGRRAAPDAARVRARRRCRRAVGGDRGRSGVLRGDEADCTTTSTDPSAMVGRWAPRSTPNTSGHCTTTPVSCSPSSDRTTSSSCTTPRPPGWPRRYTPPAARVIWRCHIGRDTPNHATELGWSFLRRVPRSGRRVRVHAGRVRSGLDLPRPPARDHTVDRSVRRQERAALAVGSPSDPPVRRAPQPRWRRGLGDVPPARRLARSRRPAGRHPPDRATTRARDAARRPAVALGSDEGHGRVCCMPSPSTWTGRSAPISCWSARRCTG